MYNCRPYCALVLILAAIAVFVPVSVNFKSQICFFPLFYIPPLPLIQVELLSRVSYGGIELFVEGWA